eukprot:gene5477-11019_t
MARLTHTLSHDATHSRPDHVPHCVSSIPRSTVSNPP